MTRKINNKYKIKFNYISEEFNQRVDDVSFQYFFEKLPVCVSLVLLWRGYFGVNFIALLWWEMQSDIRKEANFMFIVLNDLMQWQVPLPRWEELKNNERQFYAKWREKEACNSLLVLNGVDLMLVCILIWFYLSCAVG